MSEEGKQSNPNILSTEDLGSGRKRVTFSVDQNALNQYVENLQDSGVSDIKVGEFGIGRGSVKSRYTPSTTNLYSRYTSNETPYTQALKTPEDPHKKIELAVELYHKEPIIGTVIDLMVDFSSSGFTNECDDQEVKKLFDKWCKEVDMQNMIEGIFLEYYRSGNVAIYRSEKSAKVKRKKGNKEVGSYDFPAGYTILNPLNVSVEGSLLFNQDIIYLTLNQDLIDLIKGATDSNKKYQSKTISEIIPNEILKAVRSGNNKVPLSPEFVTRITRKRQPYERYASPFIERIFEPVLYKQKLRMMDMSTIEGLVNQLITVTVGNNEYPATDEDLTAIAELFQTPNKAYTIFWNHTLEVTFHKPEGIDTLAQDKYKQVNDDILAGLGVSRVLLDGQGANFSTAWVSILSLIERLDNARSKVKDWIESEYERIAEENGLKVSPTIRFNRMNLREDNYIRDVLLAMYDRGLLDEEDILQETGRDYQAIVEMKKRNQKNSELFYPPEQPFQGNNGRPPGGNENGYKDRDSNPEQNSGNPPKSKATASYHDIEEEYEEELAEIYASIEEDIYSLVEESEEDSELIESIIIGTLIALFNSVKRTGNRYIDSTFNREVSNYTSVLDISSLNDKKNELKSWNDSYVSKLANDIGTDIIAKAREGATIKEAVSSSFKRNKYRVTLMSQAGVVESVRQAKIEGNKIVGSRTATWLTVLDDATCNICRGLHRKQFDINQVPPRPHSGCRCDLIFD
jgi:hypothetical protein